MEKFSSISKVVGSVTERSRQDLHDQYSERFSQQVFEALEGKERQKTPEEIELIGLANDVTAELCASFGIEDYVIPQQNIHVIMASGYPENQGQAQYSMEHQAIAMREVPESIVFARNLIHEMLHMKSYGALQVTNGKKQDVGEYRMGLFMRSRDGKRSFFNDLNEAVTEEITIRLLDRLREHPLIKADIDHSAQTVSEHSGELSHQGQSVINSDVFYVSSDEEGVFFHSFERKKERAVLNALIEKIFQANLEIFNLRDEVLSLFAEAMITGNVLSLAKTIDRSFGQGVFRALGELDGNIEAQQKLVASL